MTQTPPRPTRSTRVGWMGALCCLLPLALLALLQVIGSGTGKLLYVLIALICPIAMILMMFVGRKCHSSRGEHDSAAERKR